MMTTTNRRAIERRFPLAMIVLGAFDRTEPWEHLVETGHVADLLSDGRCTKALGAAMGLTWTSYDKRAW